MDWKQLRAEIKEKWRRLTDHDPGKIEDRFEPRQAALQPRYATIRNLARKDAQTPRF